MKKFIAVLLMFTLVAAAFAACAPEKNNETTLAVQDDTTAAEPGQTGTTAAEPGQTGTAAGKLVMATSADFPPYEFYENDKIVGIDAEVAQLIADKLGMELEIKDMKFNAVIAAVSSGTADIAMAGLTVEPERENQVSFTDTYAKGVQVIIVKEDSGITELKKGDGNKVGVQITTTGDFKATEDLEDESLGYEVVKRFDSGAAAVAALANGTVDAVLIDNEPAKNFVKNTKGLKLLPTPYADENYAIALGKNNHELLGKVNTALRELKEDGSLQKIIDKYIPAE